MTCRSWECGVVLPALDEGSVETPPTAEANCTSGTEAGEAGEAGEARHPDRWDVLKQRVPVPMELPGAPLRPEGVKTPWFQMF